MLRFSIHRVSWAAAVYLIVFLQLSCGSSFALNGKPGDGQDIVTKSRKGDLVNSPQRKRKAAGDSLKSAGKRKLGSASSLPAGTRPLPTKAPDSVRPEKDYLDVYIGNCQFTPEAIRTAKSFVAAHPDVFVRYYAMKTLSDAVADAETLREIEIYLPLEAKKLGISTVPTFILNRGGVTYKITGVADLEAAYKEIEKDSARGTKKRGYIELGEEGSGCRAVMPDLRPSLLSSEQKQEIEAENGPPDLRRSINSNHVYVQQKSNPVYSEKGIARLPTGGRFIVFSKAQTDWAVKELKKGVSAGCCTDCVDLRRLWPYAQYCSLGLLKEFGVNSVPTVITLKGTQSQSR